MKASSESGLWPTRMSRRAAVAVVMVVGVLGLGWGRRPAPGRARGGTPPIVPTVDESPLATKGCRLRGLGPMPDLCPISPAGIIGRIARLGPIERVGEVV